MDWIETSVAQNEVLDAEPYLLPLHRGKRTASDEHELYPSDKRARLDVLDTPLSADEAFKVLEETVAQAEPEGGWEIPARASWFSLDAVHKIEREALPEFFSGTNRSKTPELYSKYRRFLVLSYRLNPEEYLTLTACRRMLVGDVWGLMRIHRFLDLWGLINTMVPSSRRPQPLQPSFTGHFSILFDTPQGLRPVEIPPGEEAKETLPVRSGIYQTRSTSFTPWSESDVQTILLPRSRSLPTTTCDTCGEKCVERYVLIATGSGPTLCAKCWSAARFPAPLRASDFVCFREDTDGAEWSQGETLRLLNALQRYGTSWPRVAQSVATRSPQECAEHFLRLPIEDAYLPTQSERETVQDDWAALGQLAQWTRPGLAKRAAHNAIASLERAASSSPSHEVEGLRNGSVNDEACLDSTFVHLPHEKVDGVDPTRLASDSAPARLHLRATKEERATQSEFVALAQAQMEQYQAKMRHVLTLDARLARERQDLAKETRQVYSQRLLVRKHLQQTSQLLQQHQRAQDQRPPAQVQAQARANGVPSIPVAQAQRMPLQR